MAGLKYLVFRGREDKLREVARLFSHYLTEDVLDIGCDMKYISHSVRGRYVGLDMAGSPDIRVDLELGLPFHDKCFNAVVAFDVLEHLDRLHFVFDELCRLSKTYLIIGLPNMYEWSFRLNFLLGKKLSGKYGLSCTRPADRHKWLFNLNDAISFVQHRGAMNGFSVIDEAFGYYVHWKRLPKLMMMLGKLLMPRNDSLFVYYYLAVLKRE